jgi:glutaredoxin-related protein
MMEGRPVERSGSKILATNGEQSSVTCIDCANFELELKRTQLKLKSVEKIVVLLREELVNKTTMATTVGAEYTSTAINTEIIKNAQDNVNSLCPCCAKVINDLEKVKTDLKTLVETVKIMKEDQGQLSVRLNNIEQVAIKEVP